MKRSRKTASRNSATNSLPAEAAEARDGLDSFARFCAKLTLEKGQPMVLEPFQRRFLSDYFAGKRESLVLLPKKNGKTSTLAALALYHLLTTPDASCYVGASSKDQARVLFEQAERLVNRSKWLRELVKVQSGYLRILSREDDGQIKVLAADANTADGVIPTLALVDELHRHKSPDLYAVFRDGLGARGGQLITISTAGDDLDSPLGKMRADAHALAQQVRAGAYRYAANDSFALHEWALQPDQDRENMDVVKSANPASWQTVEELRTRFESPTTRTWEWARFACGVWVYGEDTAISDREWAACVDTSCEIPDGAEGVMLGMDIGLRRDTTAIVPVWREDSGPFIVGTPTILYPPDRGAVQFKDILGAVERYGHKWPGMSVVIDPNAGGELIADRLEHEFGYDVIVHTQQPQPMAMAAQRLTTAIVNGNLKHPDHPELNRHVLSAVPKTVGESWRFGKSTRRSVPNDGVIALAMAVSQLAAPGAGPSVYEERELLVL